MMAIKLYDENKKQLGIQIECRGHLLFVPNEEIDDLVTQLSDLGYWD